MSCHSMYREALRQAMGSDHATPLPVVLQTKGQLAQHGTWRIWRPGKTPNMSGDVWIFCAHLPEHLIKQFTQTNGVVRWFAIFSRFRVPSVYILFAVSTTAKDVACWMGAWHPRHFRILMLSEWFLDLKTDIGSLPVKFGGFQSHGGTPSHHPF